MGITREKKHYIQRTISVDYRTMTDGKCQGPTIQASCFSPCPNTSDCKVGRMGGAEREGERSWQLMGLAEHQDHLLELKFIDRGSF